MMIVSLAQYYEDCEVVLQQETLATPVPDEYRGPYFSRFTKSVL